MGLGDYCDEPKNGEMLIDRPLYYWLKSFTTRELEDEAELSNFVSSNALNYALEYIGITPENEQSSLHLSAIFDAEDSKAKYPNHYESETKSRIQSLNKVFLELKSFFEDRYSQIVAIRPPNSVHITSGCPHCSVEEYEKLLVLILGAAIQGSQKQDTIRTIKRFPAKIQESLIACIKLIADNPELLNIKSWDEYQTLEVDERQKIYENLLTLVRKLILERNSLAQGQLITDYFAGYINCEQRKSCEARGYPIFADYEKNSEDSRLSSSVRQLREQLVEKSDLLQECREELEKARNRIQELDIEVNVMKQKQRAMKKARDELDALREGQEKAARLEAELSKLKTKLEEAEVIHERVETLEIENRNWQVKHDMLLDQISFLSFERSSRDNSFDHMNAYNGILDGLTENLKGTNEDENERNFFDSDDEELSVKENYVPAQNDKSDENVEQEIKNSSSKTIVQSESPRIDKEEIIERPIHLEISQTEAIDNSGDNLVASTPKGSLEFKCKQEVQTPTQSLRTKRQRRSSLLNLKRTRKAIIIPISPQTKKIPQDSEKDGEEIETPSQTIHLYKIYSMGRKKGASRPRKLNKSPSKTVTNEQQEVPNLDLNEGNEADEELSISPTGNPNLSDLDSQQNGTDNDSEIYFVCSPSNSNGTNTPKHRAQFGTTTAFPVTNSGSNLRRTEFAFDPQNLSNAHFDQNENESHSLTFYTRETLPEPKDSHSPSETVLHHVPSYDKHKSGQNSHSGTDDQDDDDASNSFTFGDYNIQLNLRNSIKPATALINKISTMSANLADRRNYNQYSTNPHPFNIETSSEEDGSIWYEYGCV